MLAWNADTAGLPVVRVEVRDRSFDGNIDAGSPGWLMLPGKFRDEVGLKEPAKLMGHGHSANSEFAIYRGTLTEEVRLGSRTFSEADVSFIRTLDSTGFANLGTRSLRQFRIRFDWRNERIRFADPR